MAREKMMMVKVTYCARKTRHRGLIFIDSFQKKRMMTMRNRRNFIFCKCAVTENIRKTTKKYTSKNLIILYKKIDYNINFKDENKKKECNNGLHY